MERTEKDNAEPQVDGKEAVVSDEEQAPEASVADAVEEATVEVFLDEAEALGASIEKFLNAVIPDMPTAAQKADIKSHRAALSDLVGRAAESGAGGAAELQKARDEAAKNKDAAERARADFLNYQQRAARDLASAEEQSLRGFVNDLVPVLENFALAVRDAQGENANVQTVTEALELIQQGLLNTLRVRGLEPIDAQGKPFDPHFHESVASRPADKEKGEKPNLVAEVCRIGWLWKGKVLRPAQVLITA